MFMYKTKYSKLIEVHSFRQDEPDLFKVEQTNKVRTQICSIQTNCSYVCKFSSLKYAILAHEAESVI